jgi:hypothetical protein
MPTHCGYCLPGSPDDECPVHGFDAFVAARQDVPGAP